MYKKYIFLVAIIFLFNKATQAQDIVYNSNAIKISTTAFFGSSFVLSYERVLKENMSLQITGGITAREKNSYTGSTSSVNSYSNVDKVFGYNLEGAIRFYLTNSVVPLRGIYASPYGRFQNLDFNLFTTRYVSGAPMNQQINYNIKCYEGGILFGYQHVFSDIFLFDMYFGGCLKYSESNKPSWYGYHDYSFSIIEGFDYTGVAPRAGVRIGMKF
jgi:hypothetical protein